MEIKVLGSGCATCKKLHELTVKAAQEAAPDAQVLYVTDMQEIIKSGLMHMPGLIINGKVKASGRVPSVKEIKKLIEEEM